MNTDNNFNERLAWGNRWLPQVIPLVAAKFELDPSEVKVADLKTDMTEATDLVLPDGTRIGVRVRQHQKLHFQRTVAYRHIPGRHKTEWEKVLEGACDWTFYAWENETGDGLEKIRWVNLDALRLFHRLNWTCCHPPFEKVTSKDKGLVSIDVDGFPSYPKVIETDEPIRNTDSLCESCAKKSMLRRAGIW